MTSLRCPRCGASDLHAVNVDLMEINSNMVNMVEVQHQTELACKQCGWAPSIENHPHTVLSVEPADNNF